MVGWLQKYGGQDAITWGGAGLDPGPAALPGLVLHLYFSFRLHLPFQLVPTLVSDSEIVMVDGCFMVDGPCVNHAEKAVNHVLWLTGLLGRWLTVGLITIVVPKSGW